MKGATPILSISTTMSQDEESRTTSPERAGELCSNWWPVPSLSNAKAIPGMPRPLCRMCANWMADIEDMGPKKTGCGNDWPQERNAIKPLLPATYSPVPKEAPRPVLSLNSLAPRTDQKFQ